MATLHDHELKQGIILHGDVDPDQEMTKAEFQELADGQAGNLGTPFNPVDRIKFLKDNGYEVTRDNIRNSDLSVKPKE